MEAEHPAVTTDARGVGYLILMVSVAARIATAIFLAPRVRTPAALR